MIIRKIKPSDNAQIEQIIKETIVEFGLPTTGTAYEDKETAKMYESYQSDKEVYFVLENENNIVGGAGLKALKNNKNNVCELQKMYFSPVARGKGYGNLLIKKCLEKAKELGYTQCYIETDPRMEAAIHLYKKNGFVFLEQPMGNTGHCSCSVWMIKDL
ncbi:GNAT family N-acetyltransferase [Aureibaculum sp. 2210JD6-5]|uniref:GNAT family N-acetyltransferase n=1 Tax=Aureibaculum sp. 2210JD6-5 TaxID=3103957 RepID=UPI002AACE19E|nr:GNAT family N-acetyltransferase [Aureibaculum sp. 2210JD6-5]MDY7393742.1 GNAT family N-acetyltransferase [Aureibaculum sp. 2210JD6-5]